MAVGIELERVRRTSGGRVHLTPHVPESGDVVTLCAQTLTQGTYEATQADADCRNCLRRREDAGRVSSAFFQSDVGAELLQRSLEEARRGRQQRAAAPAPSAPKAPAPPAPRPAASRPERPAPVIRELRSRTELRPTFENVYVSPDGVIVRVVRGEISHVTFNGPVDVRRRDDVLTVRVGDLVLEFELG